MIILLHSSKTMRQPAPASSMTQPVFLDQADRINSYLQTMSSQQIAQSMHISPALATKTKHTIAKWSTDPHAQTIAMDSFVGDIYSGFQADSLSDKHRQYAQKTLRILSGLYGILRPLDGIMPYRLEMAYRFPKAPFDNLYTFWGQSISDHIPEHELIINASSIEYSQVITKYRPSDTIITPQFLTVNPQTKQPAQVVVHSKIARGAFARWLIATQTDNPDHFHHFTDLGYSYQPQLSSYHNPTFICQQFGGIGLSLRLK